MSIAVYLSYILSCRKLLTSDIRASPIHSLQYQTIDARMGTLCLCFVIVQVVKDDIAQLVESQQELEANFEDAVNQKIVAGGDASSNSVQNAAANLRNNAAVFALSLKQHPLATDNLEKVQSDRFVTRVIKAAKYFHSSPES